MNELTINLIEWIGFENYVDLQNRIALQEEFIFSEFGIENFSLKNKK